MKYHSWELKSKSVLLKEMDKSSFIHHGTGIPIQIRDFFDMEKMKDGEKRNITLIYRNVPFNAHIEMGKQRKYKGKKVPKESRLFWRSDFQKIVKDRYPVHFDLFIDNIKIKSKMRPQLKFEKSDKRDCYYISFIDPKETFEERKITWKEAMLDHIKDIPKTVFTLQDVYKYEQELQKQFPTNYTIKHKIRQQIQYLRDDGYIEFIDNKGTYQKTFENENEFGHLETIMDQVAMKNYRVEDSWSKTKIRVGTNVFRKSVLKNFDYQCCICLLNLEPLLEAHHIRHWKDDLNNRLNPLNGLSLCRNHHGAVDRNFLRIKKDYRIIASDDIFKLKNKAVRETLAKFHNKMIIEPIESGLLL